jgi:hypothetical protein
MPLCETADILFSLLYCAVCFPVDTEFRRKFFFSLRYFRIFVGIGTKFRGIPKGFDNVLNYDMSHTFLN